MRKDRWLFSHQHLVCYYGVYFHQVIPLVCYYGVFDPFSPPRKIQQSSHIMIPNWHFMRWFFFSRSWMHQPSRDTTSTLSSQVTILIWLYLFLLFPRKFNDYQLRKTSVRRKVEIWSSLKRLEQALVWFYLLLSLFRGRCYFYTHTASIYRNTKKHRKIVQQ